MDNTPNLSIKTVFQKITESVGLLHTPTKLEKEPIDEICQAFQRISTCAMLLEQGRKDGALAPYSTDEMKAAIKNMAKIAISMKTALNFAAKDREQLPLFIEMIGGLTVARLELMNHVCSHIFLKAKDDGKLLETWDSLHASVDKISDLSIKHLTIL